MKKILGAYFFTEILSLFLSKSYHFQKKYVKNITKIMNF